MFVAQITVIMSTTHSTSQLTESSLKRIGTLWMEKQNHSKVELAILEKFAHQLEVNQTQAFLLSALYSLSPSGEGLNERSLLEQIKELITPPVISDLLDEFEKRGFLEIERNHRRRGNEIALSQGFCGYVKTVNPGYLSICSEPGGDGLINLCLSWHSREQDPFGFSKSKASVIRALIDFHKHPFIKRISALTTDINEQSAALYMLGYEALFRTPMKTAQLVEDLFHEPLPRLKTFHDWSNSQSDFYKKGLFQAHTVIDDQVSQIRLNPTIVQWALPKDMSNANLLRGLRSHFVELIEPQKIQIVKLRYPFEFQLEIDVFFENLQPKRFQQYTKCLQSRGLPPNLSAMLYGAPGTGKTELVRQLARKYKRPLLMVNLAGLRDKYFGESEKNITRLFAEIRSISSQLKKEPIVLFNEADGFFHQRSSSGRGTDQTETALVALFLNELETFKGIVFATSNHTINMDKAFERRWTLKLEVPAPDERVRAQILYDKFKGLVPYRAVQWLANKHPFSPAQVDNILKKYLLINPEQEQVDVLEQLIIHEIGGWAPETTKIGFK